MPTVQNQTNTTVDMTTSTYATGPIITTALMNQGTEATNQGPIYLVIKNVEKEYEYEESDERIVKCQNAAKELESTYRLRVPNIDPLCPKWVPCKNLMIISVEGIMGSGKLELLDMMPKCASWNRIDAAKYI
jgi:hypothetical protein